MSNYCGHWRLLIHLKLLIIDWYNSIIGDGDIKVVIVGVFDVMYWSNHVTNTDNDLALWALNGFFNLYLITKISFPFVYKASSLCFLGSRKTTNIFEAIKDYHRHSQWHLPKGFGGFTSPKGKTPVRVMITSQMGATAYSKGVKVRCLDVFRSVPATVKTQRLERRNMTA